MTINNVVKEQETCSEATDSSFMASPLSKQYETYSKLLCTSHSQTVKRKLRRITEGINLSQQSHDSPAEASSATASATETPTQPLRHTVEII